MGPMTYAAQNHEITFFYLRNVAQTLLSITSMNKKTRGTARGLPGVGASRGPGAPQASWLRPCLWGRSTLMLGIRSGCHDEDHAMHG
jgi:hypothetical protein